METIPFDQQVIGTCSECGGSVVQSKFWVYDKISTHCVRCGAKPLSKPVINMVKQEAR